MTTTVTLFGAFKDGLGSITPTRNPLQLQNLVLSTNDLHDLEVPFNKEEIDLVTEQMLADKALGPVSQKLLKACWHIVTLDFCKLIEDFYQGHINMESINYFFITMIPKKDNPLLPWGLHTYLTSQLCTENSHQTFGQQSAKDHS